MRFYTFPLPTRPREVICLSPLGVSTDEGDGYVYFFVDVYAKRSFTTGVEEGPDIEYLLKHIQLLIESEAFKVQKAPSFTLVLDMYEEDRSTIEAFIKPHGGTLVIDEPYMFEEFLPYAERFFEDLAKQVNKARGN